MDNRTGSDSLGLERIVFFSDAVMAIAITLLAIDLRLPDVTGADDHAFWQLLADLAPRYFSFAISFAVIAIYWLAHHRIFGYIERWDAGLITVNLVFLFFVVQLPLLNSILGSYGNLSSATAVYAIGLALLGFASAGLWVYAVRARLVANVVTPDFARRVTTRALAIPIIFLLSIPLAFVSPFLAELSWLAIAFGSRIVQRTESGA